MVAWSETARRIERWILPPECIVCQAPVGGTGDELVCDVCCARWRPIDPPFCATCGEPTPLGLACRVCADWPPDFGPVRSAVQLDESVRQLVHRFKYQGWRRLAEPMAARMAPLVRDFGDADLVPIPLARSRRRIRGYNQAAELAGAVARITGQPVRPARLRRVRDTPTQTRLAPEARRANLAEAFAAGANARPALLIDDVFTTGATLFSAAQELLDQGADRVGAVTFARAELPLAGSARRAGRVSRFSPS